MSHYSGHVSHSQVPQARVAFFGCSLVAVGLIGFYTHLQRRHKRKLDLDAVSQDTARISSWEYRMLQRGNPTASSDSPAVLRASRIEGRSTPMTAPATTHNGRHRTVAEQAALLPSSYDPSQLESSSNVESITSDENGRHLSYAQPTAQKGHPDGRPGVYTKNTGWREGIHYATNGNTPAMGPSDGAVEGEVRKVQEMVEKVEDEVKSVLGR